MKRFSWIISRYLIQTIVPYFLLSWLLLTVILFVQQAGRFSDIFFNTTVPSTLVWQLAVALIPNVIAFTCPMALLVGIVIGLAKMRGDSELVAMRAAGIGNIEITVPIVVLGIVFSLFAFIVNLKGVPLAAAIVRRVAIQTAIYKLESPIEPGVFNTDIAGYTIYVKDGDVKTGTWKNIFIYSENPASDALRLITSTNGRIDVSGDASELVLENALAITIPREPGSGKFITENIGNVRIAIKTKRGEMLGKLTGNDTAPDELGISQLTEYAAKHTGREKTEALILWQRRIIQSLTPLIFCLLGSVMILRSKRGSRGRGLAFALLGLIGYYLIAFFAEQLARTETVGVYICAVLPLGASIAAILIISLTGRVQMASGFGSAFTGIKTRIKKEPIRLQAGNIFVDLTTGLRDLDLVIVLIKNFLLASFFLASVFVIFTAFDLWKFAGSMEGGIVLLGKYLFFLLPFMYLQLAPSAAMISTLATYVIKSRQNEVVTWTSAGLSVYRLLIPCFILMAVIGVINWEVQERITPAANQRQDSLRLVIRSRGNTENKSGRIWVADENRIYSFIRPAKVIENYSLNNEIFDSCGGNCVKDVSIYEFSDTQAKLKSIYRAEFAGWMNGSIKLLGRIEKNDLDSGNVDTKVIENAGFRSVSNPFADNTKKVTHLTASETKDLLSSTESESERINYQVALEKKYSTIVLPFVIALFTAPFSLSLSRKGKVITVGYAVGLWLLFMGTSGVFEQFGLNGFLSPQLAVWGPLAAFATFGLYLLSRIRT